MERVTLRKLTGKSILGFGKYADLSVQQLIDLSKKAYLRWVYFNASNIDFMEDILIEIRIIHPPTNDDRRIAKPGKNPSLGKEFGDFLRVMKEVPSDFDEEKAFKGYRFAQKRKKAEIKDRNMRTQNISKIKMQRKNQGH